MPESQTTKISLRESLAGYDQNGAQAGEAIVSLQEKIRLLEEENEALKDKIQASELAYLISALKISNLAGEVGLLRKKLLGINVRLDILKRAHLSQWIVEMLFKNVNGTNLMLIPRDEVMDFIKLLRENIGEISSGC